MFSASLIVTSTEAKRRAAVPGRARSAVVRGAEQGRGHGLLLLRRVERKLVLLRRRSGMLEGLPRSKTVSYFSLQAAKRATVSDTTTRREPLMMLRAQNPEEMGRKVGWAKTCLLVSY